MLTLLPNNGLCLYYGVVLHGSPVANMCLLHEIIFQAVPQLSADGSAGLSQPFPSLDQRGCLDFL